VHRRDEGIALVNLHSKPVNALSSELMEELLATLQELDEDESVRGFVLGSALPGVFSAGINLPELLVSEEDGSVDSIVHFWTLIQETWMAMYTTQLATVAAISGGCQHGGCILALSCDSRVMHDAGSTIGLDEVSLGLVPPPWLSDMLVGVAGQRRAEDMIMHGTLLQPDEALAAGIVDATMPPEDLEDEAVRRLSRLLAVSDTARRAAKQNLRQAAVEKLRANQSEDLDEAVQLVSEPAVQETLREYLANVRGRKAST